MSSNDNPFAMQPRRTFFHHGLTEIVVTPFMSPDLGLPESISNSAETGMLEPIPENLPGLHACVIRFEQWQEKDSWLASFPAALSGIVIGTTEDYVGDNPEIAERMLEAIKTLEFVHRNMLVPIDLYVVLAHPDMTLCRHFTQAVVGKPVIVIEAPQTEKAISVAGQVRLSCQAIKASAQNPKQMGIDAQWLALAGLLGPLYFHGIPCTDFMDFKFALGLSDVNAARTGGFVQLQNSSFDALVNEFDALLATAQKSRIAETEPSQVAAPASRIKVWFHFCPSPHGGSQVNYRRLCAIAEKYADNQIGCVKLQSTLETAHQLNFVWTCAADIEA